jgi:hypothetical protein
MPPRSLNELDAQIAALKRKLREAEAASSSGSDRRALRRACALVARALD